MDHRSGAGWARRVRAPQATGRNSRSVPACSARGLSHLLRDESVCADGPPCLVRTGRSMGVWSRRGHPESEAPRPVSRSPARSARHRFFAAGSSPMRLVERGAIAGSAISDVERAVRLGRISDAQRAFVRAQAAQPLVRISRDLSRVPFEDPALARASAEESSRVFGVDNGADAYFVARLLEDAGDCTRALPLRNLASTSVSTRRSGTCRSTPTSLRRPACCAQEMATAAPVARRAGPGPSSWDPHRTRVGDGGQSSRWQASGSC